MSEDNDAPERRKKTILDFYVVVFTAVMAGGAGNMGVSTFGFGNANNPGLNALRVQVAKLEQRVIDIHAEHHALADDFDGHSVDAHIWRRAISINSERLKQLERRVIDCGKNKRCER